MPVETAKPAAVGRKSNRIEVLDGYRALAILAVLAFHYTTRWAAPFNSPAHFPAGAIFDGFTPFEYGWLGVEFFFVISGFVILMTLENCRSIGEFALRRFARIWPALVVAATMTTLVMRLIGPNDWVVSRYDYITSIFLIHPEIMSLLIHHPNLHWVDGVYWSLWVEVRFYILAAILYFAARKNFIKYWLILQLTTTAAESIVYFTHSSEIFTLMKVFVFPQYLPYFTLGVCIYEIYFVGPQRKLAMFGALAVACIIIYSATFHLYFYEDKAAGPCVVANLSIFALFALFVMNNPIVFIFRSRPMVALGQASYSLYLIHQSIGIAIMKTCVDWGVPYFVILPLTIGLVIVIAFLLFRYLELPARAWISQQARRRRERAEPYVSGYRA